MKAVSYVFAAGALLCGPLFALEATRLEPFFDASVANSDHTYVALGLAFLAIAVAATVSSE